MQGVIIYAGHINSDIGKGTISVSTGLTALVPTFDVADAMTVIVNSNITPHELHRIADLLSNIALGAAWRHDPCNDEEEEVSDDE